MALPTPTPSVWRMKEKSPTCAACGDIIGVYEPLMWLSPEGPREGGLLTLPDAPQEPILHRACWLAEPMHADLEQAGPALTRPRRV